MNHDAFEAAASPQYELQKIGYAGLNAVLSLWDSAKNNLSSDSKHHLKPLTETELARHQQSGFPVLGMIDTATNRLAAVLLVTPNVNSCGGGYTPASILELPKSLAESGSAVLQCLTVHPDYAGQGLMKSLLEKTGQVAKGLDLCRTFAKVADDNQASRGLFKGREFTQIQPTSGQHEGRIYTAHYFAKSVADVSAEPIALQELPLFNGSHNDNDNAPAFSQRSLC